ncbi:hypothetical protein VP01_4205g1 [Puccinia sorghi]|uniref:Uncharacterized protein n=1 Tax=Puccinia sorghi TaxID=27349 RepID=A0A0L6UQQ4_9BASI|nr:hypothetical protein VP01_4205g1 [Puccinia sorghi]
MISRLGCKPPLRSFLRPLLPPYPPFRILTSLFLPMLLRPHKSLISTCFTCGLSTFLLQNLPDFPAQIFCFIKKRKPAHLTGILLSFGFCDSLSTKPCIGVSFMCVYVLGLRVLFRCTFSLSISALLVLHLQSASGDSTNTETKTYAEETCDPLMVLFFLRWLEWIFIESMKLLTLKSIGTGKLRKAKSHYDVLNKESSKKCNKIWNRFYTLYRGLEECHYLEVKCDSYYSLPSLLSEGFERLHLQGNAVGFTHVYILFLILHHPPKEPIFPPRPPKKKKKKKSLDMYLFDSTFSQEMHKWHCMNIRLGSDHWVKHLINLADHRGRDLRLENPGFGTRCEGNSCASLRTKWQPGTGPSSLLTLHFTGPAYAHLKSGCVYIHQVTTFGTCSTHAKDESLVVSHKFLHFRLGTVHRSGHIFTVALTKFSEESRHIHSYTLQKKKNLLNCLQLTCTMLQPSCHPSSSCFHILELFCTLISRRIKMGNNYFLASSFFSFF